MRSCPAAERAAERSLAGGRRIRGGGPIVLQILRLASRWRGQAPCAALQSRGSRGRCALGTRPTTPDRPARRLGHAGEGRLYTVFELMPGHTLREVDALGRTTCSSMRSARPCRRRRSSSRRYPAPRRRGPGAETAGPAWIERNARRAWRTGRDTPRARRTGTHGGVGRCDARGARREAAAPSVHEAHDAHGATTGGGSDADGARSELRACRTSAARSSITRSSASWAGAAWGSCTWPATRSSGACVAIKLLLEFSGQRIERFLDEARATARCRHENIVVIHEVDEIRGRPPVPGARVHQGPHAARHGWPSASTRARQGRSPR